MKIDTKAAAKKIALDSMITPGADVLGTFDRDIMGGCDSVQIRIPLLDPTMLKAHLKILAGTVSDCLALCDQTHRKDRGIFLDVRGRIRATNKKINAYKRVRTD